MTTGYENLGLQSTCLDSPHGIFFLLLLNRNHSSPSSLPVTRILLPLIIMSFHSLSTSIFAGLLFSPIALAQTAASPSPTVMPSQANSTTTSTTITSAATTTTAPDVYLNVPTLSVGLISLQVDNLAADINLAAQVANLVTINAGVQVTLQQLDITIKDIDVELELIVRLGNLVDIVNRVFQSVDLNPLILDVANATTTLLNDVVGAVDSLLGTITQGGTTLSFIVDNLGNIIQEVTSATGNGTLSSIVGNYLTNMTFTGQSSDLGDGLVQKVYSYLPLSALVDVVTNTAGQVVQATVEKSSTATSTAASATLRR